MGMTHIYMFGVREGAGTHPTGHSMEKTGSLMPEVLVGRGPSISAPCLDGH